jgi:hypothetical protein
MEPGGWGRPIYQLVAPAKAGPRTSDWNLWIPAYAGMTPDERRQVIWAILSYTRKRNPAISEAYEFRLSLAIAGIRRPKGRL